METSLHGLTHARRSRRGSGPAVTHPRVPALTPVSSFVVEGERGRGKLTAGRSQGAPYDRGEKKEGGGGPVELYSHTAGSIFVPEGH